MKAPTFLFASPQTIEIKSCVALNHIGKKTQKRPLRFALADVSFRRTLLAARRSPRTVDAHRRDLADLAAALGRPPSEAGVGDLETWAAGCRPSVLIYRAEVTRATRELLNTC